MQIQSNSPREHASIVESRIIKLYNACQAYETKLGKLQEDIEIQVLTPINPTEIERIFWQNQTLEVGIQESDGEWIWGQRSRIQ